MKDVLKMLELNENYMFQGSRYRSYGENSGQAFREDFLKPWLDSKDENFKGTIDFEGTLIFMPSFINESFGVLYRNGYEKQINSLKFINLSKENEKDIKRYIRWKLNDSN